MKILSLLVLFCSLSAGLFAMPKQVLLIRHGEKPAIGNGLSKAGFQRAAALVPFFMLSPQNPAFNQPDVIFSQATSSNHQTTRPCQTVAPLASALGVDLISQFSQQKYDEMVKEIKNNATYNGQTVLICWCHQCLGDIAASFGVSPKPSYPGGAYDRLWVIDFSGNDVVAFQDLPQQLMYGDSQN